MLPYSSGTTGNPKGVMLTHRNLVANVAQIRPLHGMVADDAVLAVLPFFHIYGMTVLLNAALHARARLVVMPSFDLSDFLANIQNHKCTIAFIAPPVAVALAKHPLIDDYDLSSLNTVMSGAAPLDADLGRAVAERLGCRVVQGYGMSELSPVSHITPFDGGEREMETTAPLSSVGWTVSNAASKLVDPETGAEIDVPAKGLSETGELWFKGPNVMAGYLGNEKATEETIDDDGWLHTGDLAQVDAVGCVYIVDRLKELIKYKGYQVPPAELEAVLLSHPGDRRCRGDRGQRRRGRRSSKGVRGQAIRNRADRRRGDGIRRRTGRALQEGASGRIHRRDSEVGLGQDPAKGSTAGLVRLPLSPPSPAGSRAPRRQRVSAAVLRCPTGVRSNSPSA